MTTDTTKNYLIVTGEASGDILGGKLATALKQQQPTCTIQGVGSTHMQAAGVDIIFNSDELAVMGLFEIIKKLPTLRRAMKKITHLLNNNPPDALILIDYPGFNLRLAARAKKAGVKVMFYVSPQIWAWHYSRIKKIKQNVDLMAVLFPFEEKIYQKENVPVTFVGHPLVETLKPSLSKAQAYQSLSLNPDKPIIGLVPGSRPREIESLLPDMLACVKKIKKAQPDTQFILPLAANLPVSCLDKFDLTDVQVIQNNTYNAVQLCTAAIVTSGTVTLEIGLLQIPMVIIYRMNALTYHLCKYFIRVKTFGLCNIVAEKLIALELFQNQISPEKISKEILKLMTDKTYHQSKVEDLSTLREKLNSEDSAAKTATAAVRLAN